MYRSPVLKKSIELLYMTPPWRTAIKLPWFKDHDDDWELTPDFVSNEEGYAFWRKYQSYLYLDLWSFALGLVSFTFMATRIHACLDIHQATSLEQGRWMARSFCSP